MKNIKDTYKEFIEEKLSCSECGKSCFDKSNTECENCEHSEFYDLDEDTIQHCLQSAINKGYKQALKDAEKIIEDEVSFDEIQDAFDCDSNQEFEYKVKLEIKRKLNEL